MKRDEEVYLRHILDAVLKVQQYLQGIEEQDFLKNELVQDGVIRQIEIMGEAAKHVSEATRAKHRQVPWEDIAGMRDKLIHDYFGVDIAKVWLTTQEDLPVLKSEMEKILSQRL